MCRPSGVTATDSNGDTDTGVITVNVLDDGVTANDDFNSYDASAGVATGNVVTGLNGGAGAADDLAHEFHGDTRLVGEVLGQHGRVEAITVIIQQRVDDLGDESSLYSLHDFERGLYCDPAQA